MPLTQVENTAGGAVFEREDEGNSSLDVSLSDVPWAGHPGSSSRGPAEPHSLPPPPPPSCLRDLISFPLPVPYSAAALQASLLVLKRTSRGPASGPLHLGFVPSALCRENGPLSPVSFAPVLVKRTSLATLFKISLPSQLSPSSRLSHSSFMFVWLPHKNTVTMKTVSISPLLCPQMPRGVAGI